MGKTISAGQISLFEDQDAVERDRYLLRQALRHGGWSGYRVRVLAAFTYPHFQQYAHLYLQHEMQNSGGTVPGSCTAFMDCTAAGLRILCTQPETSERRYTWRQCVPVIRELIDQDEWLTKSEEMEVGHIVEKYGGLPYPRSRLQYPEAAWNEPTETQIYENRGSL